MSGSDSWPYLRVTASFGSSAEHGGRSAQPNLLTLQARRHRRPPGCPSRTLQAHTSCPACLPPQTATAPQEWQSPPAALSSSGLPDRHRVLWARQSRRTAESLLLFITRLSETELDAAPRLKPCLRAAGPSASANGRKGSPARAKFERGVRCLLGSLSKICECLPQPCPEADTPQLTPLRQLHGSPPSCRAAHRCLCLSA